MTDHVSISDYPYKIYYNEIYYKFIIIVAAPTIWNSLSFDIRNSCSIASFRRKLKTFYFSTSSHL